MKKHLQLKKMILVLAFAFLSTAGWAQVALPHYEAFNYPVGKTLQLQAGWSGLNTGDSIFIASGNLSYTGLKESTGNKITFGGLGNDVFKTMTTQTANKVYYSFIMKVTNLGALNAVGGYFTGFGETTTTFGATIWTGLDGTGYKIGINPRTSTTANMAWVSGTQALNSSIFVVACYEFVAGTGNDVASIWVNPAPSTFGSATVPAASASAANAGGTDLASIVQFFIRQDSDTETPTLEMDEFRVGTTWAEVTPTSVSVGLGDKAPAKSSIYPNPSNGWFKAELPENGNYTISISNAIGSNVKSIEATKSVKVETAALKPGLYFVTIQNRLNNTKEVHKLIVR